MNAVPVMVVGIILALGLLWQGWLILRENRTGIMGLRMKIAIPIAVIIFLGVVGICAFRVFLDKQDPLSKDDAFSYCLRALILSIAILIKSYLSPIVLAVTAAYFSYYYLQHNQIDIVDFLRPAINWVFVGFLGYFKTLYLVLYSIIVVIGAICKDTFIEIVH